jgi:small subunit ribosomal protein S16
MLIIRLSRQGKTKHALFRVIISEKARDTAGRYLELLGHYDPHTNVAVLKADRIKYWISQGATVSGTVHNLLVDQKIIDAAKIKVANIKKKPEEKKPAAVPATAPAVEVKKEEKPAKAKPEVKKEEKPVEIKPEIKPEAKAGEKPTEAKPS